MDQPRAGDGGGVHTADERDAEPGLASLRGYAAQVGIREVAVAVAKRGALLAAVEDVVDGAEQLVAVAAARGARDADAAPLERGEIGDVERRDVAHLAQHDIVDAQHAAMRDQQVGQRGADVAAAVDEDLHGSFLCKARSTTRARRFPSTGTSSDAASTRRSPATLRPRT